MIAEHTQRDIARTSANNGSHVAERHEPKRFDIFLIDSGWNTSIGAAVKDNIDLLKHYLETHNFYVLTKDQSMRLLKQNPLFIGSDPMLMVIDREGYLAKKATGYGFRLNLGILKDPDAAIGLLKWVLQIVSDQWTAMDVTATVRKASHKEGVQGTLEIIVETSSTLLAEGIMV